VSRIVDSALRVALTATHRLLKLAWFVVRPKTFGAHALALTPEGKIVLVKLRYAPSWRVPGGGRNPGESATEAALRELREEIGMTSHGTVTPAREFEQSVDSKRDTASLVVVRDVRYRPRWSWEVEAVREVDLHGLPKDTAFSSRYWIEELRPLL
jgi:8-oxo-dGTP pyrophosphatase MutT (NUDIX family)